MSVFVWPLAVLWIAFGVAHYLTRNTGRHHVKKSWFRKLPAVRDELLIRSMDECPQCKVEMYVFKDTCGSCGFVRYAPDESTLRMPVTHHRRPGPEVRVAVMT